MKGKRIVHSHQDQLNSQRMRNAGAKGAYAGSAQRERKRTRLSLVRFVMAVMVVSAIVCIILFSGRNVTSADESGHAVSFNKYYKTVTIHQGDSLWTIADEYRSGDYRSTQEYVDELKSMNNLHSDRITAGMKLVVAYFSED